MKILAYVKHEKNKYFTQPKLFIKSTFKIYGNIGESFMNLSNIFIDSELDIKTIPLLNFSLITYVLSTCDMAGTLLDYVDVIINKKTKQKSLPS